MVIIGIDPGKSGGIAIIQPHNSKGVIECIHAFGCPEDISGMNQLIRRTKNTQPYKNIVCYLEQVHAFPTDGRSSVFKFGMNYGIWQGILGANQIYTKLVIPRKWQSHFGELPKDKQERKRTLKMIASEQSGLKATLKTADAICIALYGLHTELDNWKKDKNET